MPGVKTALGLIGDPVDHSLSPLIHHTLYAAEGREAVYLPIHVRRGELPTLLRAADMLSLAGFNATMPHKRDILPLLGSLDESAARFESANTMRRMPDGTYRGYTTDGPGLSRSLAEAGLGFRGRRVLILGAGGVSPTVALTACFEGARAVAVLNRTPERAAHVAALAAARGGLDCPHGPLDFDALPGLARGYDLVVNTTPLGMRGFADMPRFDFLDALPQGAAVVDLIYNPAETSLLRQARARGIPAVGGLGMLAWQGFLAHEIWFGSLPEEAARRAVFEALAQVWKEEQP
ncbi:MAG: shikimate dehydrogenase family protein [Christensenellales bacterium]|jgi:shikimate dehydrogenase